MGSISPIPPAVSIQSSTVDTSAARAATRSASAAPASAPQDGGQPVSSSGVVDSVSLSTDGGQVSGTVSYFGGEYVASEPGPPQVSVSGSTPTDAANKLVMTVYRIL